jgi:hypothetical protein
MVVMATLLEIFPEPRELLALEPEELAGLVIELVPGISQWAGFRLDDLTAPVLRRSNGYPQGNISLEVVLALGEALWWLENQGIIMRNPTQPVQSSWYIMTRRGRSLKTRIDLDAFRKGRTLPLDLLQESLV